MKMFILILVVTLLFFVTGFYSCTGKSSGESGGNSAQNIADPKMLGEEIGKKYNEMMDKLIMILEYGDDLEKLKQDVADLKEEYIEIYVEYGRMREKLSESDRPKVDSALMSYFGTLDNERFKKYSVLQQDYFAKDSDLGGEISSFNILTQYAFFELLKKQEPKEAERLGIE